MLDYAENLLPVTRRNELVNEDDGSYRENTTNGKITKTPFSLFKDPKLIDRLDRMTFCRDKNQKDIENMRQVLDNAVNDTCPSQPC
ncbi:MAG: hypothetical protein GY821_04000 [Gammaproteobacteria bacterium]|nr:hypothetical protein [Gammaproteobacteria bacterium]